MSRVEWLSARGRSVAVCVVWLAGCGGQSVAERARGASGNSGSSSAEFPAGSSNGGSSSGSGGSSNGGVGSSSGSGGSSSGGGPADEVCSLGAVSFRFDVREPERYCTDSCGTSFTISDESGTLGRFSCDLPSCSTCKTGGCPGIVCSASPLTSSGFASLWDGGYFARSSCGDGDACQVRTCAAPGRFVARLCLAQAGPEGICEGFGSTFDQCTEVAFDYPADEMVVVEIE